MINDIKRHLNKKGVKTSFLTIALINLISFFMNSGFSFTTLLFSTVGVFIGFFIFSWGYDNPEEGKNHKKTKK